MTDTERAEYNDVIRKLTTRLEEAVGEIDRLKNVVAKVVTGTDDAHSTLRRIYLDEAQSPNTRLKAAQASINFEKSRLENVPPPLDLVAEPARLPLHELVRLRRARAKALEDPGFPGGIVPPDHPRARAWSCKTEAELQEKVRRWEDGEDISGGNGDGSNSGGSGDNTAG